MSAFLYTQEGKLCCIPSFGPVNSQKLVAFASQVSGGSDNVYLLHNGHLVYPSDMMTIVPDDVLRVLPRVPGGKGGFGSMLRALGAQIEKTTSREACRDLSGRRMRDVNDEKKITEWVSNQAEREREAAKLKQERIEKRRAAPRHTFDDASYTRQIQENAGKIEDALKQGLRATASTSSQSSSATGVKRSITSNGHGNKKQKMWLGMDEIDSDEDIVDEENQSSGATTTTSFTSATATSTATTTSATTATSTCSASTCSKEITTEPHSETTSSETESTPTSSTSEQSPPAMEGTTEPRPETTPSETESTPMSSASEQSPPLKEGAQDVKIAQEPEITEATEPLATTDESQDRRMVGHSTEEQEQTSAAGSASNDNETKKTFCIDDYSSAAELEGLGLDGLKKHLMSLGLKCGGTLQERAQRLFLTKRVPLDKLDPSLFAKPAKGKKHKQKK